MRTWRMWSWVMVVLASGPIALAAEDDPPCLAETRRFCGEIPDTGAFVQNCLEQHRSELSAACRKHVGHLTADTGTLESSCRADLRRHCASATLAAGGAVSCLVAHRDALSERCRTTLDEVSAKSIE